MIAHVVEFHGQSDQLEVIGMKGFHERVVPVLRAQPGFAGCLTLLNREHGKMLGVTLWDTEENGRLAGARLEQERRTGVAEMGADSPQPDFYEVLSQL
ncbi:MAG TPA: hypothetical protein VIU11_06740 [Nakamurella sp.]